MLTYLAIAARLRPRWIVWENVPGVLSSNGGRDFGTFLGALGELRYGWAYRVLDAQYVRVGRWPRAVPQRRRRVFVVGCLGDGAAAAEILALREGLQRHLEASGKARKGVAADAESGVARCITTGEMKRQDYETCTMIAQPVAFTVDMQACKGNANVGDGSVSPTLCKPSGNDVHAVAIGTDCYNGAITGDVAATMGTPGSSVNASGPTVMQAVAFKTGNSAKARSNAESSEVTPTLGSDAGGNTIPAVAFHPLQDPISSTDGSTHCMGTGSSRGDATIAVAVAPSLTATNDPSRSPQSSEVTQQVAAVYANTMTVRRLTPRECERLQGFPDDYTLIPWRKKPAEECPDGPRYKALGNSMAVNCMAWIGERIAAYEATP